MVRRKSKRETRAGRVGGSETRLARLVGALLGRVDHEITALHTETLAVLQLANYTNL